MRTKFQLIVALFLSCELLCGQSIPEMEEFAHYFEEVKEATRKNKNLWNLDLYAPIMLVDASSRRIFANEQDSLGTLKAEGELFTGELPRSIKSIANTSINWNGTHWAMILLPLPESKDKRLSLICHELFHRAQHQLKFTPYNPDNKHLDEKTGITYLRLELEALRMAVQANSKKAVRDHITNALYFRSLRYREYPCADTTENQLELNEGLTEYTGLMMSDRSHAEMISYLTERIETFQKGKSFIRTFAYQTIPAYGYLASLYESKYWNKDITVETNLSNYFKTLFQIQFPANHPALETFTSYSVTYILSEEEARDEANQKRKKELIAKFVELPHLEIHFEKMSISFDPGSIISLDEHGTVYPTIRVTDQWGILTVKEGALMAPNWNKITVTAPKEMGDKIVSGEGWTLEINSGYEVTKANQSQIFTLRKK